MEIDLDAIELGEPAFGEAPEGLDAIDVYALAARELMLAMVDAQVPVEADIDEAIIATPTIGVDHAFERDAPLDNGLQRGFFAVRHDLGVDSAVPLEDAKHGLFKCAATALQLHMITTNPAASEVAFIQLNLAVIRKKLFHLPRINRLPEQPIIAVDRLSVQPQQFRRFAGINIQAKTPNNFCHTILA